MMALELAELLLRGKTDKEDGVRVMLGTVTNTGAGNLRVRPDSMVSGDIGPMRRASNYTPALNDRVLLLWLPDSFAWIVLFAVVQQP